MGQAKQRKRVDPTFGQSPIVRFLESGTSEYYEALSDLTVKKITQRLAKFYLLKAALPGCFSELLCVGHPVYDDRAKQMNCYLYALPNDENRSFVRKSYTTAIQKQVSVKAVQDYRAADVVIVEAAS